LACFCSCCSYHFQSFPVLAYLWTGWQYWNSSSIHCSPFSDALHLLRIFLCSNSVSRRSIRLEAVADFRHFISIHLMIILRVNSLIDLVWCCQSSSWDYLIFPWIHSFVLHPSLGDVCQLADNVHSSPFIIFTIKCNLAQIVLG